MEFLDNLNNYDIVCGILVILAFLYGAAKGLLSMLEPFIAIVLAKISSVFIKEAINATELASDLANIASEKTGISTEYEIMQMSSAMVAETLISVGSFLIAYILIRTLISIFFTSLRDKKGLLFTGDKLVGAVLSLVIVCVGIYVAGIGSAALAQMGVKSVAEFSQGMTTSLVPGKIIFYTGTVLNDIRVTVLS